MIALSLVHDATLGIAYVKALQGLTAAALSQNECI